MSSISIGVAALVAIDSFAANVTRSVREQSRALLGGDVQLSASRPFPIPARRLLDSLGRAGAPQAHSVTFPSMALVPRTGATRLSQIRAVSAGYPLYGAITTQPANRYALLQRGAYALVDPSLLVATGARVGDTLKLGFGRFTILATLESVPGTSGITSALGPRIYIAERYVPETQLLTFGSTADYATLLSLAPGADSRAVATALRKRLAAAQVRVRSAAESEQTAAEAIDQLSAFIGIVGLVALLLGGIGVASGVRAFVAQKIDTVAILRCLGATSGQVLTIYVAQAAAMGLVGSAAGAALGVALQLLLPRVIGQLLPVDVVVTLEPTAILTGLLVGGWGALVFSLRPLLALRTVSPLQTLRRDADSEVLRMRWSDRPRVAIDVAIALSVVAFAVARARNAREGLWTAAATMGVIVALVASSMLLSFVARRSLRASWPYVLRQGVANVYRPANQTRAVILSLGFGAFLITTLYLVQGNLLRRLTIASSGSRANLVFFDVQRDQTAALDSLIGARGFRVTQRSPVVQMRIAAINGRSVASLLADTVRSRRRAPWALRRDFRSTYRDSLLGGEKLASGKWFGARSLAARAAAGNDTSEVSMASDVAEDLRLRLGDVITWDIQGVQLRTRVTSLRDVTWARFEPNFFAVFPSAALRDAPQQSVLLAEVPGARNVATLQREVVLRYPNVSSLDLSLVRETITRVLSRVTTAIRFMALFSLGIGIPVLVSAVAATRRERVREAVLLKTLGATRGQIIRILLTEYALLGLLGSFTGLLLAIGGGWAVVHFIFRGSYTPALDAAALIALGLLALTVSIGLLAGRDVFRETAMTALRDGS